MRAFLAGKQRTRIRTTWGHSGPSAHAWCQLVLWGGTPVPRPTPPSASSDLGSLTSSRARAPGAAQGSRPTTIVRIWEN